MNYVKTAVLAIVLCLGYGLLLQRQFSQPVHQAMVTSSGKIVVRGETLMANDRAEIASLPGATLTVGEHSGVTLLDCVTQPCTVRHITGEVEVSGQATLQIRDMTIAVEGTGKVTHYSWKDEVAIQMERGAATVRKGDEIVDQVVGGEPGKSFSTK